MAQGGLCGLRKDRAQRDLYRLCLDQSLLSYLSLVGQHWTGST